MEKDEFIRVAQSRVKKVFTSQPDKANNTTHAAANIAEGLTCTFAQGEITTTMDMPEIMGGNKGLHRVSMHVQPMLDVWQLE